MHCDDWKFREVWRDFESLQPFLLPPPPPLLFLAPPLAIAASPTLFSSISSLRNVLRLLRSLRLAIWNILLQLDIVIEVNKAALETLEFLQRKMGRMKKEEVAKLRLDSSLGASSPSLMYRALKRIYGWVEITCSCCFFSPISFLVKTFSADRV